MSLSTKKKDIIQAANDALTMGNADVFLSFCTDDIIVKWGDFVFKGPEKVGDWVAELKRMFTCMRFREIRTRISGKYAIYEFAFDVVTPNELNAQLQCIGKCTFSDGKIHSLSIKPVGGTLEITPQDIRRLELY